MNTNRREFIRHSLVVLGSVIGSGASRAIAGQGQAASGCCGGGTCGAIAVSATGAVVTSTAISDGHEGSARTGTPGRKWVMVIDLAKCDGCGACTKACSKMHFVPPDRQWIKVLRMQESESTAPYFFPQPCYHCDNPPCTKVCPVDATFKRQDGIVLIDNDRCIGCRFCMAACPYGARSFNWGHPQDPPEAAAQPYSPEHGFPRRVGTVEKCDFCPDMAEKGILPACTAGCPMGAIYYGDENEDAVTNSQGETSRLSTLLRDRAGYRHLEELGTKPRVYYLPPKNRSFPFPVPGEEKPQPKATGHP